jgi:hypothetical protein
MMYCHKQNNLKPVFTGSHNCSVIHFGLLKKQSAMISTALFTYHNISVTPSQILNLWDVTEKAVLQMYEGEIQLIFLYHPDSSISFMYPWPPDILWVPASKVLITKWGSAMGHTCCQWKGILSQHSEPRNQVSWTADGYSQRKYKFKN